MHSLLEKEPNKIILVDVRSTPEQEVSMVPKAITKEDFELRKGDIRKEDFTVVPYWYQL